jgi:hypothetical protein
MYSSKTLKQWQVGYLAAMIDAEAHVGIQKSFEARRKSPSYVIRFEIAMTDRKTIEFINSILPSAKVIHCVGKNRRSPYYRLRLCQKECLELLRATLPFVQGKKRSIELCFEMDALRRRLSPACCRKGLPPEFEGAADKIFRDFRALQLKKGRK